jgi:hypothetical protein
MQDFLSWRHIGPLSNAMTIAGGPEVFWVITIPSSHYKH